MRRAISLLLLLVALPQASAAQVEVRLGDGVFEPAQLSVQAGDTVLFVNGDARAHTVTSAWDGGETLHVVLKPGEAVPVVLHEAGAYQIRCVPHSTMEGDAAHGMAMTIEVAAGAPAESAPRWTPALVALGLVALGVMAWTARAIPLRRWLRG